MNITFIHALTSIVHIITATITIAIIIIITSSSITVRVLSPTGTKSFSRMQF